MIAASVLGDKMEKRRKFKYKVSVDGSIRDFNILRAATDAYGFHHGQRVKIQKGKMAGTYATIIGCLNNWLWRHQDDADGARAFFAKDEKELRERYDLLEILHDPYSGMSTTSTIQLREELVEPIKDVTSSFYNQNIDSCQAVSFTYTNSPDFIADILSTIKNHWKDRVGPSRSNLISEISSADDSTRNVILGIGSGLFYRFLLMEKMITFVIINTITEILSKQPNSSRMSSVYYLLQMLWSEEGKQFLQSETQLQSPISSYHTQVAKPLENLSVLPMWERSEATIQEVILVCY